MFPKNCELFCLFWKKIFRIGGGGGGVVLNIYYNQIFKEGER